MDIEEIKKWYIEALSKYVEFSGRARRQEFWTFTLVNFVISVILAVLDSMIGMGFGFIGTLFSLAIILPSIAVGVRRLHDIGKEGWWLLIGLIPIIGLIVLIYFYVQDSEPGANVYGPNPKGI
ncbi:MAG: DUF805 domain-containing protein [Balneolaceae bacterium]|nr:DUF805 domain-containing protein [Balneolaceae bacterium]